MKNLIKLLDDDLSMSDHNGKMFIQMAFEYFNESSMNLDEDSPYGQDLESLYKLLIRIHQMHMFVGNVVDANEDDPGDLMATSAVCSVLEAMTLLGMVNHMVIKDHMYRIEDAHGEFLMEKALAEVLDA